MNQSNHGRIACIGQWMFAVLLIGMAPMNAKAQTFCNPMYMPPGTCVPYDHMAERQKELEQRRYEARTRIYAPEQWDDFIRAAKEYDRKKAEEARRKLEHWAFHQSKPDEAVKGCQATFLSVNNGVTIIDVIGEATGTFIGYFGMRVPRPASPGQVKVSLTQGGETQTVMAQHVYLPWDGKYGMILFAVPSTKALLGAIDDVQDYTVTLDGKVVSSGQWRDGLKAREWLQTCVDARAKGAR